MILLLARNYPMSLYYTDSHFKVFSDSLISVTYEMIGTMCLFVVILLLYYSSFLFCGMFITPTNRYSNNYYYYEDSSKHIMFSFISSALSPSLFKKTLLCRTKEGRAAVEKEERLEKIEKERRRNIGERRIEGGGGALLSSTEQMQKYGRTERVVEVVEDQGTGGFTGSYLTNSPDFSSQSVVNPPPS